MQKESLMSHQLAELTTYRASDRRCYNGAYCDDLAKEILYTKTLEKRMKQANPAASCAYFPEEDKYLVFTNLKILTNNFHSNKQDALIEAILLLERR